MKAGWREGARARGVTLVELLVVLALLGFLLSLSTLAFARLRLTGDPQHWRRLAQARTEAIRNGIEVATTDSVGSLVRFLPDGRMLGPNRVLLHGTGHASQP